MVVNWRLIGENDGGNDGELRQHLQGPWGRGTLARAGSATINRCPPLRARAFTGLVILS